MSAALAVSAIARFDGKVKGKVPCNSERGWVGTKPGCKRAKKGTAQRVRGVYRVRKGKKRRPAKATVKKKNVLKMKGPEFEKWIKTADLKKLKKVTYTIDWGGQPRGHGNKHRGTKGSLSSPLYKKTYQTFDFGNSDDQQWEYNQLVFQPKAFYLKARARGLSHDQAMVGGYAFDDGGGYPEALQYIKDFASKKPTQSKKADSLNPELTFAYPQIIHMDRPCGKGWVGTAGDCKRAKVKGLATLGKSAASWAAGKAVGAAVASVAQQHGIPPGIAARLAESGTQALFNVAMERKGKSSKRLAADFISETAAIFTAKDPNTVDDAIAGGDDHVKALAEFAMTATASAAARKMTSQGRSLKRLFKRSEMKLDNSIDQDLFDLMIVGAVMGKVQSKKRGDSMVTLVRLDKKGKTPCNSERGWVGTKPGCKRAKKGTAQRVRSVQRVRKGKSRRPAKATVKKGGLKVSAIKNAAIKAAIKETPLTDAQKKNPEFMNAHKKASQARAVAAGMLRTKNRRDSYETERQPILDHQDFLDIYPDHDVVLTKRGNYLTLEFSDDMPMLVAQELSKLKAQFGEMGTAQKRYCSFNVPSNYCPSKTGDRIADYLQAEGLTVRQAVKPEGEMTRKYAPKTTRRFAAKQAARLLLSA